MLPLIFKSKLRLVVTRWKLSWKHYLKVSRRRLQKIVDNDGWDSVKIIFDDTDVFVCACNFFPVERTDITVLMEPTQASWTVTDIGETAWKRKLIKPSLLTTHALTCYDSVCCFHNVGIKAIIKTFQEKHLTLLGDPNSNLEAIVTEVTNFIGIYYGMTSGTYMSHKR